MKEVDDVLGGAAAWENVDSCDEKVDIFLKTENENLLTYTISVSKVREQPRIFHANPDKVGYRHKFAAY